MAARPIVARTTDSWPKNGGSSCGTIGTSFAHAEPCQLTTTNLGGLGWADRFDRHPLSQDLDMIFWDDNAGQGHLEPWRNGATHDLVGAGSAGSSHARRCGGWSR
jgi:hypothetical protein